MPSRFNAHAVGGLLGAGLVFVSAGAPAANGITISHDQETAIAIGMTVTEVERLIGRPAHVFRYRIAPGPTWTYNVAGAPFGRTAFDIDFGPDGKVVSVGERVLGGTGK